MITSVVISNQQVSQPAITGYTTLKEAVHALAEAWPLFVSEREQYAVLADYSGSMLLLENSKPTPGVDTGHHPAAFAGAKFDHQTVSGLSNIINAASGATANTFWMNTGLRPCELVVAMAADLMRLREVQA